MFIITTLGVLVPMIDLAPGQNHVFERRHGVEYYVPEVFHNSPLAHCPVPVFARDLLDMSIPSKIYRSKWLTIATRGSGGHSWALLNNWPVNRVAVEGRVVGHHEVSNFGPNGSYAVPRWHQVFLDDSSGGGKMVLCLVPRHMALRLGHNPYGFWVRVEGTLNWGRTTGEFSVDAAQMAIKGRRGDLDPSLRWWKQALAARKLRETPWLYRPNTEAGLAYDGGMRLVVVSLPTLPPRLPSETLKVDDSLLVYRHGPPRNGLDSSGECSVVSISLHEPQSPPDHLSDSEWPEDVTYHEVPTLSLTRGQVIHCVEDDLDGEVDFCVANEIRVQKIICEVLHDCEFRTVTLGGLLKHRRLHEAVIDYTRTRRVTQRVDKVAKVRPASLFKRVCANLLVTNLVKRRDNESGSALDPEPLLRALSWLYLYLHTRNSCETDKMKDELERRYRFYIPARLLEGLVEHTIERRHLGSWTYRNGVWNRKI